jgi:hypothetical protein
MIMTNQATGISCHRVADVLCPDHRAAAVDCWPFPHDFTPQRMRISCRHCWTTCVRLSDSNYNLNLRTLPDLDDATYNSLLAVHEAGHLLVGFHAGHVARLANVKGRGSSDVGGCVLWEDGQVDLDKHLAVLWAGQMAMARRMQELGISEPYDMIDCYWLAEDDTNRARRLIAQYSAPYNLGQHLAATLLEARWDKVSALAGRLQMCQVLEGDELRDALEMAA